MNPFPRFVVAALLLAGGVATLRGQSALDGFNPNADNLILAAVIQLDRFTEQAGDHRQHDSADERPGIGHRPDVAGE